MKSFCIALLLFLSGLICPAQIADFKIDSLNAALGQIDPLDTMHVVQRLQIGLIFFEQGKLDSAQFYADQAQAYAQRLDHFRSEVSAVLVLAHIHIMQGNLLESITLQRGLLTHPKADQMLNIDVLGIQNSLGISYQVLEDHYKAIELFTECIDGPYAQIRSIARNNMAKSLMILGKAEEAKHHYHTALREFKQDLPHLIDVPVKIHASLAELFVKTGELDSAKQHLTIALQDTVNPSLGNALLYARTIKCKFLNALGDYQTTLKLSSRLLEQAENSGGLDYLTDLYQERYKANKSLNRLTEAIEDNESYRFWNDSLNSEEKKRIALRKELEMTFNYEQKIAELNHTSEIQLARSNYTRNITYAGSAVGFFLAFGGLIYYRRETRRKQHRDQLLQELNASKIKALRAQLDPHMIRNALTKMDRRIARGEEESARDLVYRLSDLLHLTLLNSDKDFVSLSDDLELLQAYLEFEKSKSSGQFTFEIITDERLDLENTAFPSLLLQPYVENSIIHGFRNRNTGHIRVSINLDADRILVRIEDNGSGINIESIEKVPEKNNHLGFGTRIAEGRLKIIDAIYKTKSFVTFNALEEGTRVEISLPLIEY